MLIKTKSFTIATYQKGDPDSEKLALLLPGKLDSKDYAHMRSHVDMLAGLGFLAISFDPPGIWESPGDISIYNVTNYVKAIEELIEYYGNRPTFLVGHSRGGSMAMLAGMKNPAVKAFTSIMSIAYNKEYNDTQKSEEWKKKGYRESERDLPPGGGEKTKVFRLPYSFFLDQIKYDMTEDLEKSAKPKLFILGKRDITVPGEIIRKEFTLAGKPKELYELDWDHNYRHSKEKIEEVNQVLKSFLQKYWK